MPSPKGGAAIVFGKIQVIGGQGESLNECRQELFTILKRAGYPEEVRDDDEEYWDDDDDGELDEELARKEEDLEAKKDAGQSQPWKKIVGANT